MEFDLAKAIDLVLPAVITVICNILFYLWIKKSVDKSLEQYKISYSGIFKEKIDIYRELLSKTYSIKRTISRFQYIGTKEEGAEIMESINQYIDYYLINQPFLSDEMLNDLNKMRKELQNVFDAFHKNLYGKNDELLKEWIDAGNKLKSNEPFKQIEERIISEMKKDLKVES